MSRAFNVLSAAVLVVLLALWFSAYRNGQQLKLEYDRLGSQYGELPVKDSSKFCAVYVDQEDPTRQFSWRIYSPELPGGKAGIIRILGSTSSSSSTAGPCAAAEELAMVSFRIKNGNPELYYRSGGSSSVRQFRSEIRDFLIEHWDELEFEILAKEGPAVIPRADAVTLLSIKIPESLYGLLPENLSESKRELYRAEPIFEMMMGDENVLANLP